MEGTWAADFLRQQQGFLVRQQRMLKLALGIAANAASIPFDNNSVSASSKLLPARAKPRME